MTIATPELRRRIRSAFPALAGDTVFLENAGGSQVPAVVADRIRDYMVSSYVQLGAGYPLSQRATAMVDEAHEFVRLPEVGISGTGHMMMLEKNNLEIARYLESWIMRCVPASG